MEIGPETEMRIVGKSENEIKNKENESEQREDLEFVCIVWYKGSSLAGISFPKAHFAYSCRNYCNIETNGAETEVDLRTKAIVRKVCSQFYRSLCHFLSEKLAQWPHRKKATWEKNLLSESLLFFL